MGEWSGVVIAIVSRNRGGVAATCYRVGNTDRLILAIPRSKWPHVAGLARMSNRLRSNGAGRSAPRDLRTKPPLLSWATIRAV
jgi:hypothetical protein